MIVKIKVMKNSLYTWHASVKDNPGVFGLGPDEATATRNCVANMLTVLSREVATKSEPIGEKFVVKFKVESIACKFPKIV